MRKSEQLATSWSDLEIRDQALRFRDECAGNRKLPGSTFQRIVGLIAAAVSRTHGFRLHDVQLQAIMAGSQGAIAEMQTGEGKTVVTGAIAAARAMSSPGVHVGTTNAYLAARDLESMRPVFQLLGLTSGLLPEGNDHGATRGAYRQNITYGPGYQFGFDYLRDQVELRQNRPNRLGQRTLDSLRGNDPGRMLKQPAEHFVALIDEADSVMIDEAVTPLVISGVASGRENPLPFQIARKLAADLQQNIDFRIEMPHQKIEVNDAALQRCHEAIAGRKDLQLARLWKSYITNALRARHVLKRDVDYVVRDEEVMIVDQFTGRIFSDRTWQDGLHQAVECKEGLEINCAPGAVARITRQRYLLLYQHLAGLTGTAWGARREFKSVYRTPVIPIPTHLPCIRRCERARFFIDEQTKFAAIVDDIVNRHQYGQPILVGTRTIRDSIEINDAITARGLRAVVLNGVQNEEEADIVAEAGRCGAITIATNMAGRGTDIKLDEQALAAGGLHVVGVSPNESPRIDRQLIGRAARQGNPGSSQFFIAVDDEMLQNHMPGLGKRIARRCARNGESRVCFSRELLQLQLMIEANQFKVRQSMILRDHWMDQVRESIAKE